MAAQRVAAEGGSWPQKMTVENRFIFSVRVPRVRVSVPANKSMEVEVSSDADLQRIQKTFNSLNSLYEFDGLTIAQVVEAPRLARAAGKSKETTS